MNQLWFLYIKVDQFEAGMYYVDFKQVNPNLYLHHSSIYRVFGLNLTILYVVFFSGTTWCIREQSTVLESIKIRVVDEKKSADIEDWKPSEY